MLANQLIYEDRYLHEQVSVFFYRKSMLSAAYRSRMVKGYGSWIGIKQRCLTETTVNYPRYGGKSIRVCSFIATSFTNFLNVLGERPDAGYSVDRIENDKNYSCGGCRECVSNGWTMNVRWATPIQQANNKTPRDINTVNVNRPSGLVYNVKPKLNGGICKTHAGKYRARVWYNGKYKSLGSYYTIELARGARDAFLDCMK